MRARVCVCVCVRQAGDLSYTQHFLNKLEI